MTPRIGVLGQVCVGSAHETIRRRREREVLGMLVAADGRPVPAERLLAEVWDEEQAGPAPVQVAVSRLRGLLDPGGRGPRGLESTPAGYRLAVDRALVDVWVFEDLVGRALASPTPADRLVLGTRAVELWSGEPYAECRAPSLGTETARLVELHVTVQETRAEALVSLGHPAAAARLLAPLAPGHPYREQMWALLARAQYACARQADALATLATVRTRLADDLGVDPTSLVRGMEQAILTQDPGLTLGAVPVHRGRTVRRCRAVRRSRPALAGAATR